MGPLIKQDKVLQSLKAIKMLLVTPTFLVTHISSMEACPGPKYYFFAALRQSVHVTTLASLFPEDAPFSDRIIPLSYQLKYSHMKCSKETILRVQ